mgnify:CR=1 FL=1
MAPGMEQQQQQQAPAAGPAPLVMNESPASGSSKQDCRMSDEWGSYSSSLPKTAHSPLRSLQGVAAALLSTRADASKVPPSRFQKRKGSIYATPNTRDGHIDKNYAEKYHAKIAEMKGGK